MKDKIIGWLSNESGTWLLPVGLGLLGFMGQQSAAQAQNRATDAASQGMQSNQKIIDYMLNKRESLYDPIEKNVLVPRMVARAQSEAPWIPQARRQSQSLAAKMAFPTTDKPRPEPPSGGAPVV